jgi:hypothetical protein
LLLAQLVTNLKSFVLLTDSADEKVAWLNALKAAKAELASKVTATALPSCRIFSAASH